MCVCLFGRQPLAQVAARGSTFHRQREGYEKYLKKVWGIQRKLFSGFQVLCRQVEDLEGQQDV